LAEVRWVGLAEAEELLPGMFEPVRAHWRPSCGAGHDCGGARRRRSPGEGGAYAYQTRAGERWRIKGLVRRPDGTMREVNMRGFATRKAALAWLGDAQSAGR
jgi:hypothetical protein